MKQTLPSVSYIITVYNKAAYLREVIASLSSQKGDFDREFIFVNDGSTDHSLDIIKKETRDLAHVVILEQENQGISKACNAGIFAAQNDYLVFVDADDLLADNFTFEMLLLCQKHQAGAGACLRGVRNKEGIIKTKYKKGLKKGAVVFQKTPLHFVAHRTTDLHVGFCTGEFLMGLTRSILRRDVAQRIGGADERVRNEQDRTLSFRAQMVTDFVFINDVFCYEINDENDTGRITSSHLSHLYDIALSSLLFAREQQDDKVRHLFYLITLRLLWKIYKRSFRYKILAYFSRTRFLHMRSKIKQKFLGYSFSVLGEKVEKLNHKILKSLKKKDENAQS
ncbi:MAG: glycosyltransferase family 2 protein [Alphaproteobacteria bacterium]